MSELHHVFVTARHIGPLTSFLLSHFARVDASESTFPLSYDELRAKVTGCDALLTVIEDRVDEALLEANPQLKVVANVAVGFDNIDVAAATRHGVLVCNTPGVLDNATADLAFGLLLACARSITAADTYVRDSRWKRWSTDLFLGTDVFGKTIGIIGLGRIGKAMAKRARGFDCRILYWQRHRLSPSEEELLGVSYAAFDRLLQEADFVSIHCPLSAETRHLIDHEQFALMKPDCILINTARGAIINEGALIKALFSKQIAGAGLDVFEDEPNVPAALLSMPNVVVTPHIGSATVETRSAMAMLAAKGAQQALQGKLPDNCVNPQVWETFTRKLKGELTAHTDE